MTNTPANAAAINPRTDPNRREKILTAAHQLIASEGVDGVSHRKVAALAGVPLGSMTYHFAGREELIFEVFSAFAHNVSNEFDAAMRAAQNPAEALEKIADLINNAVLANPQDLVMTHEIYALAARNQKYREITHAWMKRSRTAFEQHFTPEQARILDALVEGWTIHRALDIDPAPKITTTILGNAING